jgi:GNAT superfamily N-acetyltransferase
MRKALQVRRATAGDFAAVTDLLATLGGGRPASTAATLPTLRLVHAARLGRADVNDLVAVVEGEVVGFCSLEFRARLNHTTLEAWIPDLIVREAARGGGAGRALLEEAFAEARRRGCHRVSLESGHQRTVAHKVYERVGMHDTGKFFTLELH